MATILRADVATEEVQPKNGRDFSLEEMNAIVGGYIEIVNLRGTPKRIMVVNEEGLLKGLRFNALATGLYHQCPMTEAPIVGDVLLCLKREVK